MTVEAFGGGGVILSDPEVDFLTQMWFVHQGV